MTLRLADSFVDGSAFINLVRLYEAAEGKKQRVTGGSGDLTDEHDTAFFRGLKVQRFLEFLYVGNYCKGSRMPWQNYKTDISTLS